MRKVVDTPSFFNFFKPPQPPSPEALEAEDLEEEELEELDERLETDYQIGEEFKEKIIPRAVDYFTGRALRYEDGFESEDMEDFEDEDDFEDDDDEEVSPFWVYTFARLTADSDCRSLRAVMLEPETPSASNSRCIPIYCCRVRCLPLLQSAFKDNSNPF